MKKSHVNHEMIRAGQLVAIALLVITILVAIVAADMKDQEPDTKPNPDTSAPPVQTTPAKVETPSLPASAPTSPAEPEIIETTTDTRYALSIEERRVVEAVVAAESGYESFEGQVLVAQCILNTAEARGLRPDEVVMEPNQYADPNYELAYLVEEAVAAVFDDGYKVTDEPVRFFYAPKYCTSKWHEESLTYVLTEGGHRFFKL